MKKSFKGSGPRRREIVKSLLERKKPAQNDESLLAERDAAANSSTAENCSQTRVRLESYGVTFPYRRNFTTMEDKRTWDCVKKPFQAIVT